MEAAVNENDALSSSSSDCHRPISAQQLIKKNNNNHNQPLRVIHTAPSSSTAPSFTTNTSSNRRSIMNSNVNNNNEQQNVKVVARIRPLSTKEINEKSLECITANTDNSTIHVTDNTSSSNSNSSLNNDNKRTFNFDAVYNSNTSQEELYEKTIGGENGNMISNSIFNGYNATILAYGQTGSGKVCFCVYCLFEVVCVIV